MTLCNTFGPDDERLASVLFGLMIKMITQFIKIRSSLRKDYDMAWQANGYVTVQLRTELSQVREWSGRVFFKVRKKSGINFILNKGKLTF